MNRTPAQPSLPGNPPGRVDWQSVFSDRLAGTRVCVTGGAGFIGSHLVDALVALGAHVVVLDDLSTGSITNLATVADRLTLIRSTILTPAEWSNALKGCRYVFHLAALGSVPRSVAEPDRYQDVNTLGTLRVLQAAQAAGVARVIFSGSSSAYGDAPGAAIKTESMPPLPRSPYAATKLAGEHLMRAWSHSYGLDTAVLRYFNIFGPRQSGTSAYAAVIAAFASAMRAGRPGTIFGDGRQTRDFTFVANAVYANLLAATHPAPLEGEVFNIATGHAANLLELHESMAGSFNLRRCTPQFEPGRKGDVSWSKADISKAAAVLGYKPLVSFEDGLAATVRWYQAQTASLDSAPLTARRAA